MKRYARILVFVFVNALVPGGIQDALSQTEHTVQAATPLYVTMHSAPIDDYCAPCIISEKLLKESHLTYRKILEPMGPWPWFTLTDASGNQRTIHGGLSQADVDAIKQGRWPQR
jgi:hypothetical protein